jgi:acyl-CoA synthetase (AMP-forming)/AMP-acid ligase II
MTSTQGGGGRPSLADVNAMLTAPGQFFELEDVVVRGIPLRTWKNAPPSLRTILESSRGHAGDFLVYEDEHWSFGRHYAEAAQFAHVLRDRFGVERGDRVAIAMRNFPEWSIAFWGAASAGAVVVPLNAWWTGPELEYGLADSGSVVVVCDQERLERIAPHRASLTDLRAVVVARGEPAADDVIAFDDLVGSAPDDIVQPEVEVVPEDDATIFYTSGTTGQPKGALGTHRNICTNLISLAFGGARGALRSVAPASPTGGSAAALAPNAYLLSVPFFHATGCHSVLVANLAFGGKIVLMYRWDAGRALELIERERITTFGGVPAMVWQVLDHPDFAKRDLSSVTSIGYGGAPAAPELVRRIEAMFPGRTPSNGYGLTETSSVTTLNSGTDYIEHPDSVGVPVPVVDVKVVDGDGATLPTGDVGELWIKGPNVVKGYWNKPDATAATFSDGWLHSGDLARVDDDGFVYIVDRAKDMIIRGGENVYCVEVEAALFEHPAVNDAAVIGLPHTVLGEEVGAIVYVLPGSDVSEDDLKAHVAERLAAFKVPVRIWFRSEPLPRNPAGKILKRDLRDELLAE